MKSRLNLIAMIIQTVSCALLCVPGMYYNKFWEREYNPSYYLGSYIGSYASYSLNRSKSIYVSFLSKLNSVPSFINVLALLSVIIVTIFLYYNYFCAKKMPKFISFLPIVQILLYLISSLSEDKYQLYDNWHRNFEVSTLFYIEMILLILVAFLSVFAAYKTSKEYSISNIEKLKQ